MSEDAKERAAIVCVDDEPIILLALRQELRAMFGDQFSYEAAPDATQAMTLIDELTEDSVEVILVISDWLMPGIKGDEFLLQARSRCPGTCAVMITGHADEQSVAALREQLPDLVVIRKPWSGETLRRAVEECIARHQEAGC